MSSTPDDRLTYDELREFEPYDWPGRYLVDQDNMGDWGFWLQDFDGPDFKKTQTGVTAATPIPVLPR